MGYCLNRLDEPVLIAVSKPLLTEFGIHHILESCGSLKTPFAVSAAAFMQPEEVKDKIGIDISPSPFSKNEEEEEEGSLPPASSKHIALLYTCISKNDNAVEEKIFCVGDNPEAISVHFMFIWPQLGANWVKIEV